MLRANAGKHPSGVRLVWWLFLDMAGCCSGAAEALFSHPVDTIKTRIQVAPKQNKLLGFLWRTVDLVVALARVRWAPVRLL